MKNTFFLIFNYYEDNFKKNFFYFVLISFFFFFLISTNTGKINAYCYTDCGSESSCNKPVAVDCDACPSGCTQSWQDCCTVLGTVWQTGACCDTPEEPTPPEPTPPPGQTNINLTAGCTPPSLGASWSAGPLGSNCNVYIRGGSCDYTISNFCNGTIPNITQLTGSATCPDSPVVNGGVYQLWVDTQSSSTVTVCSTATPPPTPPGGATPPPTRPPTVPPPPSGGGNCPIANQTCWGGLNACQSTSGCQNYVCDMSSFSLFGSLGVGKCISAYEAPVCRPSQVVLTIQPQKDIKEGTLVQFKVLHPPTSIIKKLTGVYDTWTPRMLDAPCYDGRKQNDSDPPSSDPIECKAISPGQTTWIHYWKNCAPGANLQGDCHYTSGECSSYPLSFYINAVNVLPPGGLPCGDDPTNKDTTCATALGPFKVGDPRLFIKDIFTFVLGLAGALGVLLTIYAGYLFMTSRGDKQKVQNAREVLVAAVAGILFIILSVTILQVIGVQVLQLPGFGG